MFLLSATSSTPISPFLPPTTCIAQGALVGFPDEVSLGEASAEPCARNRNKSNPDILLALFSSEKYKPFIVITPSMPDGKHFRYLAFTCYIRDVDGSKVHIEGQLEREE